MNTLLSLSRVQWYAIIAIILGIALFFFLTSRSYNRLTCRTNLQPPSFFVALIVAFLEWAGAWVYRILIIGGIFFLLLVWFNKS